MRPDLILLDVEMPVMDGLVTLRKLRARGHKMPVIMCSSLTQRGAQVTIEALAGGASDYVAKPAGQASREAAIARAGAGSASQDSCAHRPCPRRQPQPCRSRIRAAPHCLHVTPPPLPPHPVAIAAIAIGAGHRRLHRRPGRARCSSARAARRAFRCRSSSCSTCRSSSPRLLAERLNGRCPLRVREASEGDAGAAGNDRTSRAATGTWRSLRRCARRRPAHAAPDPGAAGESLPARRRCALSLRGRVYGAGVLAVVLTGMGSDGLAGCRIIREQGGSVLAQDQATSTVWGMPGAVAQAGLAQQDSSARRTSLRKSSGSPAATATANARELRPRRWCSHGADSASVDYGYLRQLVFGLSQNVLDPSRDYLFETRLSKLLRNQGMTHLEELVEPPARSEESRPRARHRRGHDHQRDQLLSR